MSKIQSVVDVIKGQAYFDAPLQDYHAAKAVVGAMRRKDPNARLSGVREALNKYRVSAWFNDAGAIVLRRNGQDALTL